MDKTRKTVLGIIIGLLTVGFIIFLTWALITVAAVALFVLAWVGKFLLILLSCFALGYTVVGIVSLITFLCGSKDTWFEKWFVAPIKNFFSNRESKVKQEKEENWAVFADKTIKDLTAKLKKTKDSASIQKLISLIREKLITVQDILNRGETAKGKANAFTTSYKERRAKLKDMEREIAEELKEANEKADEVSKAVRHSKFEELQSVQAKLRDLEGEKRHFDYIIQHVDNTRSLIVGAKEHLNYMLNELERKLERQKILGE